ncbi:hypothetical protein BH20PSE1_BH20PSE1_01100 [soil metagenome]
MARKELDSRGEYTGQGSPIEDPYEHGDNTVEVVEGPVMGGKLDIEKFMNEIVTVVVHDTTDKNAITIIPVSVNGRTQNFIRGRPQRCRRCYVERLARAKETSYSQNLDAGQGEGVNILYPHAALSYPFSVTEDDNPNGAGWLRRVLAEAA